jgi:predicted nucleotidyltransferase
LGSSVLRWPDREEVDRALRLWAAQVGARDERVLRVGYFGSYARGNWGVGSDVDLVVIVAQAAEPLERRALAYDASDLPVPADVFVYAQEEWEAMLVRGGLPRTASREVVWVLER